MHFHLFEYQFWAYNYLSIISNYAPKWSKSTLFRPFFGPFLLGELCRSGAAAPSILRFRSPNLVDHGFSSWCWMLCCWNLQACSGLWFARHVILSGKQRSRGSIFTRAGRLSHGRHNKIIEIQVSCTMQLKTTNSNNTCVLSNSLHRQHPWQTTAPARFPPKPEWRNQGKSKKIPTIVGRILKIKKANAALQPVRSKDDNVVNSNI